MKKASFFILLLSAFFIAGCFRLTVEKSYPLPGVIEQQYYETADLKIILLEPFAIKDENGTVTLSHTVETFLHTDFCDFKGDSLPTTTFKDLTIKFSFTTLSLDRALTKFGGEYLKEFVNTDGTIKEETGFLEKTKIGDREGYRLIQGVEGCGHDQYYFPTENGVLIVQKNFVPELTDLNPQKEKFSSIPGVILPDEANELFEKTVRFTGVK